MESPRHRTHHSHHSHDRSKSPFPPGLNSSGHHRHQRSRSPSEPYGRNSRHSRRHKRTRSPSPPPTVRPFNAAPISKHDFETYREVFADYLDIQKRLVLDDLERGEAKGRFKSFVKHYNHGELARGWYERVVNKKGARDEANTFRAGREVKHRSSHPELKKPRVEIAPQVEEGKEDESSDEELVGPFPPGYEPSKRAKAGPTVPTRDDLDLQQEQLEEDLSLGRLDLRNERKHDRKLQKEQLEELVPRAEPGTRERKLEKKKEVNEKMKSFREKSPDLEVDDSTLMGAGGTEGFKQKKAAMERKKNDRELRKEQILRARVAEREERLRQHKDKEEKTMAMLKQLASRFHN